MPGPWAETASGGLSFAEAADMGKSYVAPIWMTFNQAKNLIAHVRKDEKGSLVVFADTYKRLFKPKTETRRSERFAS